MGVEEAALPRFKCLFCKDCCFFREEYEMPTVFPWEKRLLEELAEGEDIELEFKPLHVFIDGEGRCTIALYRWIIRGYCPFLDIVTARCRIHTQKPLACRMYPLTIEANTGKLMVSYKCKWVAEQGEKLVETLTAKPELIRNVFPLEFEAAIEAYIEITSMLDFAERNKLKAISPNELNRCREVMDFDEYVARFGEP